MKHSEIIRVLSDMVLEQRLSTFHRVLQNRTRYITVVLEDLFQSHNASAVIRSCDCSGIQDVHLIENNFEFAENPDVALGASQWVNLIKYNKEANNTLNAINNLKKHGYRIVATTPHTNETKIQDLDLSQGKIALLFGSELPGLSDIALQNSDEFVKIPMFGFTESYNISVSAAICLYELVSRLHMSDINWQLSNIEKEIILSDWLMKSVKDSENIIKTLKKRTNQV
ncbi:MAG TPA: RNA methyltransferase [Bacteroidales bacterium]|nr:RNA methyltransferase [Bacteroidales bacterium]